MTYTCLYRECGRHGFVFSIGIQALLFITVDLYNRLVYQVAVYIDVQIDV